MFTRAANGVIGMGDGTRFHAPFKTNLELLIGSAQPVFTRASTQNVEDYAGLLCYVASGSPAFGGLRVVTNRCLQSQSFQTTWDPAGPARVTVSANSTTAPDGTTTADTITETTTNSTHRVLQSHTYAISIANAPFTFSIYMKPKSGSPYGAIVLTDVDGNDQMGAMFDLTTGAVSSTIRLGDAGVVSATSVALADGWYRLIIKGVVSTNPGASNPNQVFMFVGMSSDGATITYTGDTGRAVYVWGAQLETGTAASEYIPTTTASVTKFYDYALDDVTKTPIYTSKGYLSEPSATNLLLQSQTLGTSWTTFNTTVTSDQAVAPDGTLTADRIADSVANAGHNIYQDYSTTTATTYTLTAYFKNNTRRYAGLQLYAGGGTDTGGVYAYWDLQNGSLIGAFGYGGKAAPTTTITALANGWYRCSIRITITGTLTSIRSHLLLSNNGSSTSTYIGDGTSIYAWGAQLEATAFATSYIPTTTTSATRAATVLTYNQSVPAPVSIYAEYTPVNGLQPSNYRVIGGLDDGTTQNRIFLQIVSNSLGGSALVWAGNVQQAEVQTTSVLSAGVMLKIALMAETNRVKAIAGGVASGADVSATMPSVNRISIGCQGSGTTQANGYIKNFKILNRTNTDNYWLAKTA